MNENEDEKIYYISLKSYTFNKNNIAKQYLGEEQKRELKNYITNIPRRPITDLHRQHLTNFTIAFPCQMELLYSLFYGCLVHLYFSVMLVVINQSWTQAD